MNALAGPVVASTDRRQAEVVRRIGSVGLLLAGLLTVVSAVTPAIRTRLQRVEDFLPVAIHQAAFAATAVSGLLLVQLARGVRRGQHRAWLLAVGLLGVVAAGHIAKGLDFEESTASAALLIFLLINRKYFRAPTNPAPLQRAVRPLVVAGLSAIVAATIGVIARRWHQLTISRAALAVVERLGGLQTIPIGGRLDRFLTPSLTAVGITMVLSVAWLAIRPALLARRPDDTTAARAIVQRFGSNTLAYFALRSDKRAWIYGDTLVSYGIYKGVCLVSPDPIGPEPERTDAWAAFQGFVTDHGWQLGVLGAGEDSLDVYETAGMRRLYVGDEGIVDVAGFSLEGGQMKGLRQAVNRIAKNGYTIAFHDPATAPESLKITLEELLAQSRKGDVERGFSMTLSRLFDPADTGLLLAVCCDAAGAPAAFCQFVPAGADGFSLDLMRRAVGEHPNGLTDFVLVRTIERLAAEGRRFLSLNFATMRAVLAGESGTSLARQVERWALTRMSDSMQIESLWKYNAKVRPRWQPRYLVYDAPDHLIPIALAVARAESFWELPVIGGLLKPKPGRLSLVAKRTETSPMPNGGIAADRLA